MIAVKIKNAQRCKTPIDINLLMPIPPYEGMYIVIEKYDFVIEKIIYNFNNNKITVIVNTR